MNDFTKEELRIILNGLLWRDSNVLPEIRAEKLKLKIASMIENYCEHEFQAKQLSLGFDTICKKCGAHK